MPSSKTSSVKNGLHLVILAKESQVIAKAIAYSLQCDDNALLLKIQLTYVIKHGKIKLVHN